VHSLVLAPDAPREIVLDRRDLEDVAAAIDRVLAYHRGARETRRPPGADGLAMLRDLIAPTVAIEVPMAAAFLEEERALVELTREQSMLLARMARNTRMAIYGCAGSGKTMLAVEHAKRLADSGRDVLFVCFNKALAKHLHATERHERVDFRHFHSLCVWQAKRAGLELPDLDGAPPRAYWDDVLPDLLVEAMAERGAQWDALIVDEAQDLRDHWLDALRLTLRDEEHAPIWLFLDDNQRVYGAGLTVPPGFFTWELGTNCRTTQAIHRELLKLYRGEVEPDARGPEGRMPEFHQATDQPAAVAALLDRLCGPDDVDPADVVVLSSHGAQRSGVLRELDGRLATDADKRRGDQVLFSSIRAFKGLESPVVVLCELEDLDAETMDQQLYVALSRARNHAIVVAPSPPGPESA
jgi:superfamily I DNA/RNA helicase